MTKSPQALPSKDDLLAFITSQEGDVGIREIARAFAIRGPMRTDLKRMIRELEDEGRLGRQRRRVHGAGELPSTILADVTGRDRDGELLARPVEWDEAAQGVPPVIEIATQRRERRGTAAGIGDRALVRLAPLASGDQEPRYSGRIIKVLERTRARMLGVFRAMPNGGGRLVPVEKKQLGRELDIPPGATGDALDGDLVAVDVHRSGRFGRLSGRVSERLGERAGEKAISQIAIHAHGIPHVFAAEALREAEGAKAADLAGREDWREVPLVTIDPADAKDHDDAVQAEPDPDPTNEGGHILRVAIADVAFYVRPASALDREALARGNSVYFADRVVPMLPERISNDLCSLRPNEDRAALAVRMVIDRDGRKRSHSFHRVLMRSHARLSYDEVQACIDAGRSPSAGSLDLLRALYAAYAALQRARKERSPLDLDLPERKILLNTEGRVDRVITPERLDAHRLIEEYMILANVAAAETLERARVPLIYRVHDEPSVEKVEGLREFLKTLDIALSKGAALRPEHFNRVLARVKGHETEQLVNEVILRSQAQAEYAVENYGHFGLHLRRYAHFTSPIRRYADLVVHRALIRGLRLGSGALPEGTEPAELAEVAAQISAAERRAMAAERETADRLIAHFMADRIGATFEGRLSGVTRAGLFVKLDGTGADGFIPVSTVGNEYFQYDERAHALVGRTTGQAYRLGDRVEVRLVEAAPIAGALRFELLSEARDSAKPRARGRPLRGSNAGRADGARKKGRSQTGRASRKG